MGSTGIIGKPFRLIYANIGKEMPLLDALKLVSGINEDEQ
jgi:hypothetical protein